jgi:hypothetical protein
MGGPFNGFYLEICVDIPATAVFGQKEEPGRLASRLRYVEVRRHLELNQPGSRSDALVVASDIGREREEGGGAFTAALRPANGRS